MKIGQEVFAVKLYELEQQYGKLQSHLHVCSTEEREQIAEERKKAEMEYRESDLLLQDRVKASRLEAVAELAKAQVEYRNKVESLLKKQLRGDTEEEDRAETAALYAEYAIDFATQSMQYALIAALSAMERQMKLEEKKGESEKCRK